MHLSWPLPIEWIDAFGAGVFSITLVHHLDLWWRRRDRPSHLWIAVSALGALMVNLTGAILRNSAGPPGRLVGSLNLLAAALAVLSLFELVQANTGRRTGLVRRVLQMACFLPALLFAATGIESFIPMLYVLALAFLISALVTTLRGAFSGDSESQSLGIGLCALLLTLVYDLASELGALPRQEGWPILGFCLLYVAATRAQSIRQEREYSELVSLRGDLENCVRVRTTELETANAHLDQLSRTDQLTGLANRRSLIDQVSHTLQSLSVGRRAGSLIMIDIDHFKQINDYFGHDAGDQVLVQVASALVRSLGERTIIARWGGEEFMVYLPDCDLEAACSQAEMARGAVAQVNAVADDRRALTASFGVAEIGADGNFERAAMAADTALYRAKHEGRNRVIRAQDDA